MFDEIIVIGEVAAKQTEEYDKLPPPFSFRRICNPAVAQHGRQNKK